jgi:predicted nucleic acid-binding protein
MIFPSDALHTRVHTIYQRIKSEQKSLVTTNWVIAETATVLSNRDSQQTAIEFIRHIQQTDITVLTVSPEIEEATYQLFCEQTTKHTSMVDCSNVTTAKHYDIPNIFSFDRFYTRFGYTIEQAT